MTGAQRNALTLVAFVGLLAFAHWWDRQPPGRVASEVAQLADRLRPHVAPPSTLQVEVEPATVVRQSGLVLGADGCVQPERIHRLAGDVEKPTSRMWQEMAGSGDQLSEDACGNLWALWFNSWAVALGGDPQQIGHVDLSGDPAMEELSRSGVESTLGTRGALWVLGQNGQIARHDGAGWERMPAPALCLGGQLHQFDGDVWLACGPHAEQRLSRWNQEAARWTSVLGELHGPRRLATDEVGVLYAAGGGELARYHGGPERAWEKLANVDGEVQALAVDNGRIAIGLDKGLMVTDGAGVTRFRALADEVVNSLAWSAEGLFAAVRNRGLQFHDGERWHAWSFAQGLASDEARDLLLDSRGRIWLAGSPVAVIEASAAAQHIVALPAAKRISGEIFNDACAAATKLLGDRDTSAAVAQSRIEGRHLVFFQGRQVCPDPWRERDLDRLHVRRRSDGALLELGYNGRRGHSDCGDSCTASQLPAARQWWRLRVHEPAPAARGGGYRVREIAPPDPLPTQSPAAVAALADNGDLWVATRDEGIWQRDSQGWRHHGPSAGFGPGNLPQDLVEDAQGAIWVASYAQWDRQAARHQGLPLQRWQRGQWRAWSADDGLHSWSAESLQPIAGGVMVGSNGSLVRITGDRVEAIPLPPRRQFIADLSLDAAGQVWLVHTHFQNGLSVVTPQRAGYLTSRQGLYADRLVALASDGEGNLWLLADDGRVAVYLRTQLLERMNW